MQSPLRCAAFQGDSGRRWPRRSTASMRSRYHATTSCSEVKSPLFIPCCKSASDASTTGVAAGAYALDGVGSLQSVSQVEPRTFAATAVIAAVVIPAVFKNSRRFMVCLWIRGCEGRGVSTSAIASTSTSTSTSGGRGTGTNTRHGGRRGCCARTCSVVGIGVAGQTGVTSERLGFVALGGPRQSHRHGNSHFSFFTFHFSLFIFHFSFRALLVLLQDRTHDFRPEFVALAVHVQAVVNE